VEEFEGFKMSGFLQLYAPKHYRLHLLGRSYQTRASVERAFYSEIARLCNRKQNKFESTVWAETVQSGNNSFTYFRLIGLFECEA
jgi:hypothetical protein